MATSDSEHDTEVEDVNVLVTGFGTFRDAPTVNASWEIARSLPRELPPSLVHPSRTHIICFREPVEVVYGVVQTLIPKLYEKPIHYDFVLHLGVSAEQPLYKFERYASRDNCNEVDEADVLGHSPYLTDEPDYWHSCPARLENSARLEDVYSRWKDEARGSDVRISTDAGGYLCEYLYYASLAYFRHKGNDQKPWHEKTNISFLHVPDSLEAEHLAEGKSVAMALIHALVDSRRSIDGNEV
ncbi:MAG: hypothetical protein M1828_006911 [Chrysothrix sp. TS-e1954]|nr:MAG: hypothetical protein M1828_006911 [Chrysothrix sp. TS-e1954]